MAQKKITDLTLRSDFDATCNIPVDDSIQTWRTTGQQMLDFVAASIPKPTIQKFLTGSGTYTKTAGCKWIEVEMVGGGGGGGGGSTNAAGDGGNGGDGGDSTFGSSLLVAHGGKGAVQLSGGTGAGTASLGSGPIGIILTGAEGNPGDIFNNTISTCAASGGSGGANALGGAGKAGQGQNTAGGAGVDNTGGGGGGGGGPVQSVNGSLGGGGGQGAGYLKAVVTSPSSTYAYAVGAGGSAGAVGTGGFAGGAGGKGMIVVREYYI